MGSMLDMSVDVEHVRANYHARDLVESRRESVKNESRIRSRSSPHENFEKKED
jgi:hypothetical protein